MTKKPEELISEIEALLQELKTSLGGIAVKRSPIKVQAKFNGLTENIFELSNEGFFNEPKSISEIHNKLKIEGINKPVTSLPGSLLLLVKKRILKRDVSGGKYYYQIRK